MGDQADVVVPDLSPGDYYIYAWLSSDALGEEFVSCPSEAQLVRMYEQVITVLDPPDDSILGEHYEVYSIEIGITGDRLYFNVRTDFDLNNRGGDVIVTVGDEQWAIPIVSRELSNGKEVISGDLYRDVTVLDGKIIPFPYRMIDYKEWITGYSAISVIDDIICMGAEFALFGWIDFSICGGLPNSLEWTMWCGNDWVGVHITPGLNADFDFDGDVDSDDLGTWQTGFGTSSGANMNEGDADGDTDVDLADLMAWQRGYTTSVVPVAFDGDAGSTSVVDGSQPAAADSMSVASLDSSLVADASSVTVAAIAVQTTSQEAALELWLNHDIGALLRPLSARPFVQQETEVIGRDHFFARLPESRRVEAVVLSAEPGGDQDLSPHWPQRGRLDWEAIWEIGDEEESLKLEFCG